MQQELDELKQQVRQLRDEMTLLKEEMNVYKGNSTTRSTILDDEGLREVRRELEKIRTNLMPGLPVSIAKKVWGYFSTE